MNTQLLQKPGVQISCFASWKTNSGEFFVVSLKKSGYKNIPVSLFSDAFKAKGSSNVAKSNPKLFL